MKKQTLVTIMGNIGSGKTTISTFISRELKTNILLADNLFQTKNPFKEDYLKNINRWAFTNELWMTIERVNLLKKYIAKQNNSITIVDSGLLMGWVYMRSHLLTNTISQVEWNLYEKIYKKLSEDILKTSKIIYLQCPYSILYKRIQKRGRVYELNSYTKPYLMQIQKGLSNFLCDAKKKKIPVLKIFNKTENDFKHNITEKQKLLKKINNFIHLKI
jgi:deoxyguanosine kinase